MRGHMEQLVAAQRGRRNRNETRARLERLIHHTSSIVVGEFPTLYQSSRFPPVQFQKPTATVLPEYFASAAAVSIPIADFSSM